MTIYYNYVDRSIKVYELKQKYFYLAEFLQIKYEIIIPTSKEGLNKFLVKNLEDNLENIFVGFLLTQFIWTFLAFIKIRFCIYISIFFYIITMIVQHSFLMEFYKINLPIGFSIENLFHILIIISLLLADIENDENEDEVVRKEVIKGDKNKVNDDQTNENNGNNGNKEKIN